MKSININSVVFDVDGVFTNGQFIYDNLGKRFKIFGAHDSDGIKLLKSAGYDIEAITADKRGFSITKIRMDDLGIPVSLVSESDRGDYIISSGDINKTCFMGDGHFDADVFDVVGYSIAPKNAVEIARYKADYVTKSYGGSGAVYEAALHILELN